MNESFSKSRGPFDSQRNNSGMRVFRSICLVSQLVLVSSDNVKCLHIHHVVRQKAKEAFIDLLLLLQGWRFILVA